MCSINGCGFVADIHNLPHLLLMCNGPDVMVSPSVMVSPGVMVSSDHVMVSTDPI